MCLETFHKMAPLHKLGQTVEWSFLNKGKEVEVAGEAGGSLTGGEGIVT